MEVPKLILQNTVDAIGIKELMKRICTGKKLRVKLGIDPTRSDITFGHMIVLKQMRKFQDMGHECIILIGDYTATIGDPSRQSTIRPKLTPNEARANAKTYLKQVFLILDERRTLVHYNSEWFSKMNFVECLDLSRKMTVAQVLDRNDFSKRHKSNNPITMVELLYPILQGYDSVMLKSDVEIGGTDQLFNMLIGRQYQKEEECTTQAVLTLPLLVGTDGIKKMSKSLGNYIAFTDSPREMFGKIMSISDSTMLKYYRFLLLDKKSSYYKYIHPMDAKKKLAARLVSNFYGKEVGQEQLVQFERLFSYNVLPKNILNISWSMLQSSKDVYLVEAIAATSLFSSKKEIRRLIQQGAVKVNQQLITDVNTILLPNNKITIKIGKLKYFRIV